MKPKHLARTLLLAASIALAGGCGDALDEPEGTRITDAQLCMFRVGTTTSLQVLEALGRPQTASTAGATLVLMYRYRAPAEGVDELVLFEFENEVLTEVSATSTGATAGRLVPACLQTNAGASTGGAR